MKLAETQARLWSAIMGRLDGNPPDLAGIIAAGSKLSPERRVEIYAQMYFWRQVDALREDFPKLSSLLGDPRFSELVAAYLAAHPSEHPSLGRLGRQLATFLREHVGEGARPDLADLASLEWARAEVFVELDAVPLESGAFVSIAPDTFAQSWLRAIPAMRLLTLRHDAIALWHSIENDEPAPDPNARTLHTLVWRKGWTVFHVELDSEEAQALQRAHDGRVVAEVCEAFAERADAARAAFSALQSWLAEGLIAGVEPP